jgi:hypothetical protein
MHSKSNVADFQNINNFQFINNNEYRSTNLEFPQNYNNYNLNEYKREQEFKIKNNDSFSSSPPSPSITYNASFQEIEKFLKQTEMINNEENYYQEKKETNLNSNEVPQKKIYFKTNNNQTVNASTPFKKLGRKRKSENAKGEHNKFSDDNMRRKIKHVVLKSLMEFINNKIKEVFNGKIGYSILKKELLTLNKEQKSDATVRYNQLFLSKTLNEIFSEDISGRFSNFPSNHNKLLINNLLNGEDENRNIYFRKLFGLTFIQCEKYYIGIIDIPELEGMKRFNEEKKELEDGQEEEYIEILEYKLKNFEELMKKKKSRKPRKTTLKNN